MSEYGQYCPVAMAQEILGEKWTVLIIRDLLYDVRHFNELHRGLPRMSRSLLVKRLRRLERAGILSRHVSEGSQRVVYELTRAGEELRPVLESIMVWGAAWAFDVPASGQLDPVLLMWWMRRRVHRDRLPAERVVVQFDFSGREGSYWLVLEPHDVSVCLVPPGMDVDVWIDADLSTFYQVWLGRCDFRDAVHRGRIEVRGLPHLEHAFPNWFAWSPAAEAVRVAAERRSPPPVANP